MSEAEEELWKPHYVSKPVVGESERGDLLGDDNTSETYYVRVVAKDGSEHCSEPPSCVKAYNADGELLVSEQLNGNEILDFMPDKSEPAEEVLLADTSRSRGQNSNRMDPPVAKKSEYHKRTNVHRLPEHLRCVLPPPGGLTDYEF